MTPHDYARAALEQHAKASTEKFEDIIASVVAEAVADAAKALAAYSFDFSKFDADTAAAEEKLSHTIMLLGLTINQEAALKIAITNCRTRAVSATYARARVAISDMVKEWDGDLPPSVEAFIGGQQ